MVGIKERVINFLASMRDKFPHYGRSIPIIARELFTSSIREKKFYLAAIYFFVVPVIVNMIDGPGTVVLSGSGIALFYAQINTLGFIKTFYLSFFLGQILLIILSADQIAGEVEMKTFSLLRSKPVYDSEIILGKFTGTMLLMLILDAPGIIIIYLSYLLAHEAEFPSAYVGTTDEVLGVLVVVLLLQALIIALTLVFSATFNKSLYAILGSMLTLFIISVIANNREAAGKDYNYLSINWLLDAFLPKIFYHLEPLELPAELPSLLSFLLALVAGIVGLLAAAVLILRNKEIP